MNPENWWKDTPRGAEVRPTPLPGSDWEIFRGRRIRRNRWDNWRGYEGRDCVMDFGTDPFEAREWLMAAEQPTKKTT